MNIYRYKNCVIFNLWSYHLEWGNDYPEIQMHGICILNIITNQFRLWNKSHWIDNEHIPLNEVKECSENTRLHILEESCKRARQNCSPQNPTGVFDLSVSNTNFEFMVENYIGDPNTVQAKLNNQVEVVRQHFLENLNPKIVRTTIDKIDPYYFQRFKRIK